MADTFDIKSGIEPLNTAYDIAWMEYFENAAAVGNYSQYTFQLNSNSLTDEIHSFGPGPKMELWDGEKAFETFRHYKLSVGMSNYHKGVALPANLVRYDPSGILAQKLSLWVSTMSRDIDELVFNSLVSNSGLGPTGYDGVSLLNNSHPHGPDGGTHDNLTTDPLSFDSYDAAFQFMTSLKDEKGKSLGIMPNLLMVGPKNRKIALQIANATNRVIAMDNTGTEATSSVVTSTAIDNVFQGEVMVFINLHLTGEQDDYWYLMDTTKPAGAPMGFKLNRGPVDIRKTDDRDDNRFHENEYLYSIELDGKPFANWWPTIYGGIS